jgi:hypothetical protein
MSLPTEEGGHDVKTEEGTKRRAFSELLKHSILITIVVLTAIFALLFIGLVWPYNDVRFGSTTSVVQTPVVEQGGQVVLSNPSFCNDDRDTYVERWADLLNDKDVPIASYELFSLRFFNKGNGIVCYEPAVNSLTLPNYVIGINGGNGRFRIRQVTYYYPNVVRTVSIETLSTPFIVVGENERVNEKSCSIKDQASTTYSCP